MAKMFNRARMSVSSTGTGTLTLNGPVLGYQSFATAGVANGDTVSYVIEDGANFEFGTGTYTSAGTTLSRTVTQSYNGTTYGTSPISVTTSAQVFITALAADLTSAANITSGTLGVANGGTGLSSLTANYIPYGNGTSAFASSSTLTYNNATTTLTTGVLQANNSSNWNYSNTNLIRNASNTASPRFIAMALDGDSLSSTVIGGYNAIWGIYDSAPTTGSTSSALNGGMIYGAYATHRWYINGSEKMRVDSSGNVGIGTTSPSTYGQLSVYVSPLTNGANGIYIPSSVTQLNSVVTGATYSFSGVGASQGWVYTTASDLNIGPYGSYNIKFISNNAERMRIDSSGNVGIGTTSPSAKLHVSASDAVFVGAFSGTTKGLRLEANTTSIVLRGVDNTLNASYQPLYFGGTYLSLQTGGANEAMRIDSSGNVGIGTSAPANKFEVYGNDYRNVARASTTAGQSRVEAQASDYWSGSTYIGTSIYQYGSTATGTIAGLSNAQLGSLSFQNVSAGLIFTNGSAPLVFGTLSAERMRIDGSGNVGIGTTSPTAKLDVYGSGGGSTGNVWDVQSAAICGSGTAGAAANNGGVLSFDGTYTTANGRSNFAWVRAAKTNATSGDASGNLILGARSGNIIFTNDATSGGTATERMRLDSVGNLLVGGTAARGTTAGTAHLDIFNGTAPAGTLTNGISLYSSSGDFNFMDASGNGYKVGFRNIPQVSKTGAYTPTDTSDVGKHISITTGGVTINASVYSAGDVVTIFNNSGSSQNITQGTSVTLRLAGTATTGTRALAQYGVATLLCITGGATPTFVVSGAGVT